MKKLLIVFGIAAIGFTFIACKKECKCEQTYSSGSVAWWTMDLINTKEECMEEVPKRKALLDSLGYDTSDFNYKCEFK